MAGRPATDADSRTPRAGIRCDDRRAKAWERYRSFVVHAASGASAAATITSRRCISWSARIAAPTCARTTSARRAASTAATRLSRSSSARAAPSSNPPSAQNQLETGAAIAAPVYFCRSDSCNVTLAGRMPPRRGLVEVALDLLHQLVLGLKADDRFDR